METIKEEKKAELERTRDYYIERAVRNMCEVRENAIINALNNRPRYLRWIPKKYYVKHFLEMHQQPDNKSDTFSIPYKVYDKLRKKYV